MKKTLTINDLHVGVQRTGGTTLASAAALRQYAQNQYRRLLDLAPAHGCQRVIVNGDLADAYDIPLMEALGLYETTDTFMRANPDIEVVWALGNHDLSKNSMNLGSVAFIGALLRMKYERFQLVSQPSMLHGNVYVIPHLPNQDLFDLALSQVPQETECLLLHVNYDNVYACASDWSLNISRSQAKVFTDRGVLVVLGHEHQGREMLGGKLVVTGNPFPTSISDCLGSASKRALVLHHGE